MVVVFAVGFAFLGVGSGGLDLASLVQSVFGSGGSGTSVSKARGRVHKHPSDPAAWLALATAYGSKGRTEDQVSALEQYVKLKPRDANQLQNLAALEQSVAVSKQNANTTARQEQASVANTSFFATRLGGNDPITSAQQLAVSIAERSTFTAYRAAANRAIATLQKLAAVQPSQFTYDDLASAATQFSDYGIAIRAYKQELKYTTDAGTKAQIRARIKALSAANPTVGG
jgi:tetratricopeptide (TPR) repeat protein